MSDTCRNVICRAVSWVTISRQLGNRRLGNIVSCGGANYLTVWVSLLMEGFFAIGCAHFPVLPLAETRRRESAERSTATALFRLCGSYQVAERLELPAFVVERARSLLDENTRQVGEVFPARL